MTVKKQKSRTDWAKVDAHLVTSDEYQEAPELTDEILEISEFAIGGKVVRPASGKLTRGRPKARAPKKSVHLRLSPDVLDHFRSTGPGWQTRIDEALRRAAKLGTRRS